MAKALKFFRCIALLLALIGALLWWMNRDPGPDVAKLLGTNQKVEGRAAVLVVALLQPSHNDPKFWNNAVNEIRQKVIPWPINIVAGMDRGVALFDPGHPFAPEMFTPSKLADYQGNENDVDGTPWIIRYRRGELVWKAASKTLPHDTGYFLYGGRYQGMGTGAAKVSAKARYLYYALLPGGYLPQNDQIRAMVTAGIARARTAHPELITGEIGDSFDPWAQDQAVHRLLDTEIDTLILTSAQPVYSDHEEFRGAFRHVIESVAHWRAAHKGKPIKIILAPWMASQPAFDAMMLEHFAATVPLASAPGQKAMGIMSLHGLPPSLAAKDSWSKRWPQSFARLKPKMAEILRAKGYAAVTVEAGSEGFADTLEDPDNEIASVAELYARARQEGYALAIALPLEFIAENSDTLYAHAALMFDGLPGYRTYQGPPANVDWSKPYVRRFVSGKTVMIYAGSPGGENLSGGTAALASAIGSVFP
jgi:protoheme ferro-lyase